MKTLILLLIIVASGINYCFATTWSCSRQHSASMGNDYSLPNVNVTLNRNIPDNTVLYTYKRVTPGIQAVGCISSQLEWHLSLQNAGTPVYEGTLNGVNVAIYRTNISGIGISVNDADGGGRAVGEKVKQYPDVFDKNMTTSDYYNMGMWVDIRIWKIAGDIPTTTGALQFTGPAVYQGLISKNAGDTFSDSTMSLNPGRWWTANYSHLKGSLTFINSTCDIQGGDKTVNLGKFDGSSGGALWKSVWKDASFKLDCPMAYGYGGQSGDGGYSNNTGLGGNPVVHQVNSVKNNPVTIKIIPLTDIVAQDYFGNVTDGILAFDGSSVARGYGVQLAWGDAATLGTGNPANPVVFNTPILANSLNSAYRSTAYALNSQAISTSADGTFKMAARFIRTSGAIEPGPAKAAVEILATYD